MRPETGAPVDPEHETEQATLQPEWMTVIETSHSGPCTHRPCLEEVHSTDAVEAHPRPEEITDQLCLRPWVPVLLAVGETFI